MMFYFFHNKGKVVTALAIYLNVLIAFFAIFTGYSASIAQVKSEHPALLSFEDWLRKKDEE